MTIDERLKELLHMRKVRENEAENFAELATIKRHEADLIDERIAGIEEGRDLSGQEHAEPSPAPVRKNRNIRVMVKGALDDNVFLQTLSQDEMVERLSKQIECRPSQIEAALRAIGGGAK